MDPVLPRPEDLRGTGSCELAAMLLTLGFELVDGVPAVCHGEGLPGGRAGYFRFLPQCWGGRYVLKSVLRLGTRPRQPLGVQAYIAGAYHNYRLLVESVMEGTRLRWVDAGGYWLAERVEASASPALLATRGQEAAWQAAGSGNTQMVAALATMGFLPVPADEVGGDAGGAGASRRVAHGRSMRTWHLTAVSADGRFVLDDCMAKWANDAWCSRPDNEHPVAVMADAFANLNWLRSALKSSPRFVRVANGNRSAVLRADASDAMWARVEKHLAV